MTRQKLFINREFVNNDTRFNDMILLSPCNIAKSRFHAFITDRKDISIVIEMLFMRTDLFTDEILELNILYKTKRM